MQCVKKENIMKKLALTDDILMKVEKPARYLGNEYNAVYKAVSYTHLDVYKRQGQYCYFND